MASIIDRIAGAESDAQQRKRDAAVKAREMIADAQAKAKNDISSAAKSAAEHKNRAAAEAEIKGEALFKEIFDKNAVDTEEYCAAASKNIGAAADYIVKRALEL